MVVQEGFRLFHNNHIVCCSTIILGLPGEDSEDVQETITLVKNLKPFQSIIVPLLFRPMETTRLEDEIALTKENLTAAHHELMAACWEHNLDWFPLLWKNYGRDNNLIVKTLINVLIRFGTEPVRRRIQRNTRRHGALL